MPPGIDRLKSGSITMIDRVSRRPSRPTESRQNRILPVAAESLVNDDRNLISPRQMVDMQLQRLIESAARMTRNAAFARRRSVTINGPTPLGS
jgi:hypothetical protein